MDRLDQTCIWGPIADSIDEVRSFELAAASASEVCGVAFADRNHPPALAAVRRELEAPFLAEHRDVIDRYLEQAEALRAEVGG